MFTFGKRKPHVLLLDDDPAIQRLVGTLLRRAGYRVDTVDKGLKAIDALERATYDVVLLDLMMPHEGGVTVVKHLRENQPDALKRVLLLTGTPESVTKKIERGVAGVVRKPFTSEELLAEVKRVAIGSAAATPRPSRKT